VREGCVRVSRPTTELTTAVSLRKDCDTLRGGATPRRAETLESPDGERLRLYD